MKNILFVFLILTVSISGFAKKSKNKFVVIETNLGTMKVEVYADVKQHADNFLKLAKEGFYDSLLFHRVIPNFMIQGGDPQSKNAPQSTMLGNGDVGYKVPAEFIDKYYHKKGALAAARDNNPEKASSGCQFYIVQGKIFTDTDLDNMEKSKEKKYEAQVRTDYKTLGGTPHLDGSYTVFGQLVEGFDILEKISNTACNASNRPAEDVMIISMKVTKK